MNNEAQNHKVIAEHVWPNASISILTGGALNQNVVVRTTQDQKSQFDFNLLETDSNGHPTTQARAHALDVLVNLKIGYPIQNHKYDKWFCTAQKEGQNWTVFGELADSPCEAIYNAACEVLGLEP